MVLRTNAADVVLMDMNMPGIAALRRRVNCPIDSGYRAIMLTVHTGEPAAPPVMQAGAAGYFSKGAASGGERHSFGVFRQRYIASDIAFSRWRSAVIGFAKRKRRSPKLCCPERELQIALMITKGQKVNEISEQRISVLKSRTAIAIVCSVN